MEINKEVIELRQGKKKKLFLEQLRKIPIVQIAAERVGVGRTTYYTWRAKDKDFLKAADEAITEGEALITDMSESQLISLIKEKNFSSIQLWLRTHHLKYAQKVEIQAQIKQSDDGLTPEQEAIVKEALSLVSRSEAESSDSKNHDQKTN